MLRKERKSIFAKKLIRMGTATNVTITNTEDNELENLKIKFVQSINER